MTLKKKIVSFSLIYMFLIVICVILSDWGLHKILIARNEAMIALEIQDKFQDLRIYFERTLMGPHDYLILGIKEAREIFRKDFIILNNKKNKLKLMIANEKYKHGSDFEKALDEGEKRFLVIEDHLPGFKKIALDILNLDNPFGNPQAGHYMERMDKLVRGLETELKKESEVLARMSKKAVSHADRIHSKFQSLMIVIGTLTVLIGIIISYYVIKSIMTPIGNLLYATRKITAGDLRARAEVNTGDEIGELANSFNKMVKELVISQEHIYSIFQGTGDAMRVIDKDFNVLQVNKVMELLTGVSSSESVGRKCYEQFYGEFCHTKKCSLVRILEGEEAIESETVKETKSGKRVPVELVATALRREGETIAVIESFRNLTKRRLAENALRENELRLKTILDSIQIGILIIDKKTHKIFDVNPTALQMIGAPKEKVLGAEYNDFIAPGEEGSTDTFELESHKDSSEYILRRANGETVPILQSESQIILKEHEYLLESFIDITERKRIEEAVRQTKVAKAERERLFSLLEVLPAFVYLQAPDYSITFANRKFRESFGDPTGKRCFEILQKREAPCKDCIAFRVFTEKKVQKREWTDSKGQTYEFYDCPFMDVDGSPLALELGIDITERKQAEKARKEAERKLEEQRARAILSDRLRSLGEMASGMAHELNQPLLGIRGLAEHILISLDRDWHLSQETILEKVKLIIQQADRMSHVIEHARMFAKGADTFELIPVQINEVILSSITLIGTQLRSRGVILKCDLRDNLPEVLANPFSLEEVIINLINNARDAMEQAKKDMHKDPPHIIIRTLPSKIGSDSYVKIEVIDKGIGISLDILPKVFEPFFTTKNPEKGTGLGLSISKSIIEGFNGSIEIKSPENGYGTAVIIHLPVLQKIGIKA